MLGSDFISTLQWWFAIFLLGTGFLPLTTYLFKNFFDKGYLFTKILGLTITTYFIFIFGLLHVLPFNRLTSLLIFLAVISVFYFLLRNKQNIFQILKHNWLTFALEELLFFSALFYWSYIHAFAPDVHGLEKYMDFG